MLLDMYTSDMDTSELLDMYAIDKHEQVACVSIHVTLLSVIVLLYNSLLHAIR